MTLLVAGYKNYSWFSWRGVGEDMGGGEQGWVEFGGGGDPKVHHTLASKIDPPSSPWQHSQARENL